MTARKPPAKPPTRGFVPCLYVKLHVLHSTSQLLGHAADWNDLWQRSQCSWPTMRAEPLAQWCNTFCPRAKLQLLIAEHDGQWTAALPLYVDRVGPLAAARLPGGDLCSVGDLLFDESLARGEAEAAARLLVDAVRDSNASLARFDAIFPESSRWRRFLAAAEQRGLAQVGRQRGVTGVVDLRGNWDDYFAARSRNFRRQMRVASKRAESEGTLALKLVSDASPADLPDLLRQGFEVEDRSWKADAGTSTLRTAGALEYFRSQAALLLQSGQLLLAFLMLDHQAIAFEYGWQSKGIYHSLKVGYDDAFARLSPGQLLRCLMLEQFFADRSIHRVDYLGPLSEATAKWSTSTYPVSRLYLASRWTGRAALAALAARARWTPPQAAAAPSTAAGFSERCS